MEIRVLLSTTNFLLALERGLRTAITVTLGLEFPTTDNRVWSNAAITQLRNPDPTTAAYPGALRWVNNKWVPGQPATRTEGSVHPVVSVELCMGRGAPTAHKARRGGESLARPRSTSPRPGHPAGTTATSSEPEYPEPAFSLSTTSGCAPGVPRLAVISDERLVRHLDC
ncbi:hypothetical protein FN846DRAFT_912672 [Sphaerosporella brunnea]|uniref:Uncharacterized protein n=1 Tax=Sphaerosporella brunnea TaxID=1250544 RepID=A0A5J5EGW8_9PEZI|nr:hypothetical protein FN846DRAFT_912672 [Sphaerosporella brunnea]